MRVRLGRIPVCASEGWMDSQMRQDRSGGGHGLPPQYCHQRHQEGLPVHGPLPPPSRSSSAWAQTGTQIFPLFPNHLNINEILQNVT